MTAASIQRIMTPAIEVCGNITPAGAIGTAIVLIVIADPIGFRDRVFDTIDKLVDARYSVILDAERRTVAVGPELA
jgi:hypothetical protein